MRAMNSRWFSFQGSTSKRVSMENERERSLREELKRIQDSKPKGDSLLSLIRKLQRLQASGPPAQRAGSPSGEALEVARLVAKYQDSMRLPLSGKASTGGSPVLRCGEDQVEIRTMSGVSRCTHCDAVFPSDDLHFRDVTSRCYHFGGTREPVYVLRRV